MVTMFLSHAGNRRLLLALSSTILAFGCVVALLFMPTEVARASFDGVSVYPDGAARLFWQGGGPYTTTLTINAPVSERSDGRFMVGYGVRISVVVNPVGAPPGQRPDGSVNVSSSGGTANPSCTASVTNGTGTCDLFFANAGTYSVHTTFTDPNGEWLPSSATRAALIIETLEVEPALSAGRRHTCYLDASGEFVCWGDEASFPNTGSPNYDPLPVNGIVAVDAGDYSTCALKVDGSIQCWAADSNFVNSVITTTHFTRLSVGAAHACGVDVDRHIRCWGNLDNGLQGALLTDTYQFVSAGNENDCAILTDGSAICWGADAWTPSGTFDSLSVGHNHACGIHTDGSLACWGNINLTPPTGNDYTEIASGSDYSCARDSASQLTCWGPNSPAVDTQAAFGAFSTGFLHTCALHPNLPSDDYLACWGSNAYGQAPRLNLTPATIPAYLPQGRSFSREFTPSGGSPGYTLSMQGSIPGMALNAWTLQGSPTTVGVFNFSLTLEENILASSLPLELNPRQITYTTQVEDATTSLSVTANPTQTIVGSPIFVTANISDQGSPLVSGSVTISGTDTTTGALENTCTVAVNAGQAGCTLSFAGTGSKTFSAVYHGDSFYLPSPLAQTAVMISGTVIAPAISAGSGFTCASDSGGALDCWGRDDSGQASPPAGIYDILSAGENHACGRSLNGNLTCWGWNGWGVASPPDDYDFSSVTAGLLHTCGLRYDGSVSCWGNNAEGQLIIPVGITFTQITAGDYHTCGLLSSGNVACWGRNTSGQASPPAGVQFSKLSAGGAFTCGIRATNGSLACWGDLSTSPDGSDYQALDAGREHACAVDSSDHLVCWGSDAHGQSTIPDPNLTFASISAGATHTCALQNNGYLLCWGSNNDGQAPTIAISPAVVPTIDVNTPWQQALTASGGREALYSFSHFGNWPPGLQLDANTGLLSGVPTQPGFYTYTIRAAERTLTPGFSQEISYTQVIRSEVDVQIIQLTPVTGTVGLPVQVAVQVNEIPGSVMGDSPTLTVTVRADDGTGCDFQLADGSGSCFLFFTSAGTKQLQASYAGDDHFKPGQTASSTSLLIQPFVHTPQIFTSQAATLVHLSDGSLRCLGEACSAFDLSGIYRAASLGETELCVLQADGQALCQLFGTDYLAATLHTGPFVALSVGAQHACAIGPAGEMTCWGENGAGQATPPLGTYLAVSAGDAHTCAIRSDGSLTCWGSPPAGPIPAGNFVALSTGPDHTCAIGSDGQVTCWGNNSAGQSTAPGGQFIAIGVGQAHTCGLQADGHLACWGANTDGQSQAPYGEFTALAVAVNHNCALRPGPQITCWGGNEQGEAPAILVDPLGGMAAQVEIPALAYWEHAFYPRGGLKPYTAGLASGALPPGTSLGITLSPAGTILYGTPQVPGIYPFVLAWEDSAAIPLKSEQPYTITVTGADLQIAITPDHPTTALFMNEFSYEVAVLNATVLAVPDVALTVTLPTGLSNLSVSNLTDCAWVEQQLHCIFNSLPAHASQSITITGLVTAHSGAGLTLTAQAFSQQANWPEIAPADNQKQATISVALANPIFFDAFDTPLLNPAWTGGTVVTAPGGVTYLGDFTSSDTLRLLLTDLPAHQRIQISFDLYVIGPWEGNTGTPPGLWQIGQDGQTPFVSTTFSNLQGVRQNYPLNYPLGNYPWRTGAVGMDELEYPGVMDTRYTFYFSQIHTGDQLALVFQSLSLPPGARWGINNVRIVLDWSKYAVFLPLAAK